MAEGVECILTNENFTTLMPHMNGIFGAGIQLFVEEGNIEVARQILSRRKNSITLICPNCESANIKFGLGQSIGS